MVRNSSTITTTMYMSTRCWINGKATNETINIPNTTTEPNDKITHITFKCHLGGKCVITPITRKFCQKCRLDKCDDIGMNRVIKQFTNVHV
ncbi:unnamed protein product [Oppiella nova]|uniref:Nuclear receptor domain-containing protein n=1 Tax=Oppiella nova TaxID=334625 RepID=A0A7R9M300_9ACAR|nr:unnamed protein product [Oppiella nova]CAG2169806.1 unnamed protein product [Oppiella nova]